MTINLEDEFAPLQVVKRNLSHFNRSAYRVYKTESEFVTVEAATALEAFRESGVKNPQRIVREIRFMERMVEHSRFTESEEVVTTGKFTSQPFPPAIEQTAQEVETVYAEPVSMADHVGENLSPDDVAALLNDAPKAE